MSLNNSYYCNDNRTVILELQEQGLGLIHLPEADLSPLVFFVAVTQSLYFCLSSVSFG